MKEWVEKKIKAELDLTNTAMNELKTNFTVEVITPTSHLYNV